ncbi:MAG: DegT/DnrJ/EryC1/StrS family aminotransferase, partial [Clostridia bacterium]|nr:DegT/DnrJ/EryC1/StrS family aminotransferase [Clostridia bacterium]
RYLGGIHNPKVRLPKTGDKRNHVWHVFAVMCDTRDDLQKYLADKGIGTVIHYPIAIADQKSYEEDNLPRLPIASYIAASELSLPIFIGMTDEEIDYVIDAVNAY